MKIELNLAFDFEKDDPILEEYSAINLLFADGSNNANNAELMLNLNNAIISAGKGGRWRVIVESIENEVECNTCKHKNSDGSWCINCTDNPDHYSRYEGEAQ